MAESKIKNLIATKNVTGTTGNTGSISTGIATTNYILGMKMNSTSPNLELQGYVAFNGAWYIQTGQNNTSISVTVAYIETY